MTSKSLVTFVPEDDAEESEAEILSHTGRRAHRGEHLRSHHALGAQPLGLTGDQSGDSVAGGRRTAIKLSRSW